MGSGSFRVRSLDTDQIEFEWNDLFGRRGGGHYITTGFMVKKEKLIQKIIIIPDSIEGL